MRPKPGTPCFTPARNGFRDKPKQKIFGVPAFLFLGESDL